MESGRGPPVRKPLAARPASRRLGGCPAPSRLTVLPYGGFYGGEAQRGMPGAVSYYVPADGVDELLVVLGEDLVHGEVLVQDTVYYDGGGPHAYDVPLARPAQRPYSAVPVALEVD